MNAPAITEEQIEVDGVGVYVRRRAGEGDPVVFVHGHPTDSQDWVPFMERLGRPAIAYDHPGWGRSDAPRDFDYSMHGLAGFHRRVLDVLGVDRHALVVHDWGGLAVIDAMRSPERLDRLVIINATPLLAGYRWHWLARLWRTPIAGELVNLTASKPALRIMLRQATSRRGSMPDEFVDRVWDARQPGIGRPALTLYRSADGGDMAAAGFGLGDLDCPALVVWGLEDPYIPAHLGRAYADRLPNAELEEVADAGHWPWIDRPEIIGRVTGFLDS